METRDIRFRQFINHTRELNRSSMDLFDQVDIGFFSSNTLINWRYVLVVPLKESDRWDEFSKEWTEILDKHEVDFIVPNVSMQFVPRLFEDLLLMIYDYVVDLGMSGIQRDNNQIKDRPVAKWFEKIDRRMDREEG